MKRLLHCGLRIVGIMGATYGCAEEPEDDLWAPDGYEVRWYSEADSMLPKGDWGESGYDPLAVAVDKNGFTPYELILEFHSGSPVQTGADPKSWGFPLHFGMAGPFVEGSELPMYECSKRGAVYDRGEFFVFCQPGKAILYVVYLAAQPVPLQDLPDLPDAIATWWKNSIAYSTGTPAERRENLTVLPKFSFYGLSQRGYEVPVTFEPRAASFPEPFEDVLSERWRVAKFDDR